MCILQARNFVIFFCKSLGQIIQLVLYNKLFSFVAHIRKWYYFISIHMYMNNEYSLLL